MQFDCTCPQCGGPFPDHPQYCSRACVAQARRTQSPLRVSERLWSRVAKTGPRPEDCWEWTGPTMKNGYGQISIRHATGATTKYVHRVAWELEHGPIPEGLFVCHACDNRRCVRPSHLFLGTPSDNQWDMVRKGRHYSTTRPDLIPRGERMRTAKLTESQVVAIRELALQGFTHRDIARAYEVSRSAITSVVRRESWSHVE